MLVVAQNGGAAPNPAGLFFEAYWTDEAESASQTMGHLASDSTWQWTKDLQNNENQLPLSEAQWHGAAEVQHAAVWMKTLEPVLKQQLARGGAASSRMVRASLLKSDFLMRSLGRPNRDQVVTVRPLELTTLEAIDLSIGTTLAEYLHQGAKRIASRRWQDNESLVRWVFQFALCRDPTVQEMDLLGDRLGDSLSEAAIEDMLWAVVMLPEFQIVR